MPRPLDVEQKKMLILLGERVKQIRQAKGFSLEDVAKKIGKDRQSIHRLEKGSFNPSFIYLSEVCQGLGIGLDELFNNLGNSN